MSAPHPETQWLSQYVLGNYGRYDVWPVRGEGAYVWDRDGKKYLDFAGGVRCARSDIARRRW